MLRIVKQGDYLQLVRNMPKKKSIEYNKENLEENRT
jgi:hypothetical protein